VATGWPAVGRPVSGGMAVPCEPDKEIRAELTRGAAECVRRAKELRDSLAPSAGCACPMCKAKGAPKKEAPKKEAPKKEAPKKEAPKKEAPKVSPITHCHCIVCVPGAKQAGCGCLKCMPACPVHPKCMYKPLAPKKEAPKKEAPKKEAPKKEAPKKEAPKKEAPKPTAPVCVPAYYPWPMMQWCYTPCVPMVCCVPKK